MWLYTKYGFFSIVQHKDDPRKLLIRARFKEDIQQLAEIIEDATHKPAEWQETPNADYRYRTTLDRTVFEAIALWMVQSIDYTNFKNAVHGNPVRDRAYIRCWDAMCAAQHAQGASHV